MTHEELVKISNDLDVIIDEPSVRLIYSVRDMVISLMPVLQILLFIALSITVLVLFSFITFSITSNSRQIGILRSIGVTRNDTVRIFVAETIIIALIALIVSYVMDVVLTIYINNMYAASLAENPFNIIIPNIAICLIIPLITVALTLVSSVIPIRMMSKKRPVEIIRSSEYTLRHIIEAILHSQRTITAAVPHTRSYICRVPEINIKAPPAREMCRRSVQNAQHYHLCVFSL